MPPETTRPPRRQVNSGDSGGQEDAQTKERVSLNRCGVRDVNFTVSGYARVERLNALLTSKEEALDVQQPSGRS
jgi:hypothetical protein